MAPLPLSVAVEMGHHVHLMARPDPLIDHVGPMIDCIGGETRSTIINRLAADRAGDFSFIGDRAMKVSVFLVALSLALVLLGCGSGLVGTYNSKVTFIEGMTESLEPGFTQEDFRRIKHRENLRLTLNRGGRFEWNAGHTLYEGKWWVEGKTLFLREESGNGRTIGAALRQNREWEIAENGDIIRTDYYKLYNMEERYIPE